MQSAGHEKRLLQVQEAAQSQYTISTPFCDTAGLFFEWIDFAMPRRGNTRTARALSRF
jgi:hypothetical protein